MEPHTKTLSSSCFYHIRSLKQIRSSLDDSMAGSVEARLFQRILIMLTLAYTVRR